MDFVSEFMNRKKVVHLLESKRDREQRYVGVTSNLRHRVSAHNSGQSIHTNRFRPWRLVAAVWFRDEASALAFERYLKAGSGRAFANRHFWSPPKSGAHDKE
jgi:predicted GIY-YIG superfamily endonuclease